MATRQWLPAISTSKLTTDDPPITRLDESSDNSHLIAHYWQVTSFWGERGMVAEHFRLEYSLMAYATALAQYAYLARPSPCFNFCIFVRYLFF